MFGQALESPSSVSIAGTMTDRTTKASMRMPMPIAKASSRNDVTGMTASIPKLTASASPAVVMAREVSGIATAIACRSDVVRASSQTRPTPKML